MAVKEEPKIRLYYKPTDAEDRRIKFVYDRFLAMKMNPQRLDAAKQWDEGEKAWDQLVKEDEGLEEWQAKYYVPLTTAVVESILSDMTGQSPRPLILALSEEDKPRATVMKHAVEYSWDVADGDEELEGTLKDCLIYGDGFVQEYYWKDRRMIRNLKNVSQDKKKRTIEEYDEVEKFDYDDVYMENVSPYELYFDETARTINRGPYKARDAIRRMIMKLSDAKDFFSGDVWDPYNNIRFVKPGKDTNYYSYFKPPEDINKKDEVEVLWYWSRRPDDALTIVINDVLIKDGPNPYKHKQLPFAKTEDVKRPHKFYHKGEPKLLESIQKEVNIIRRMITDRNHLDIDKMWLVNRNESYSEEDTITRPHGMIRVDDPANYKPVEYGDVPASVNLTLQAIDVDAQKVTGVDLRPHAERTPITATDAAILKEQLVQRVSAKLRHLERGLLVDVGRMRVSNIIQFYSQPTLEKIVGEAGQKEYDDAVSEAQAKGLLVDQNGSQFRAVYRNIRIQGKTLQPDASGNIQENPNQSYSFFEMTPDTFMPVAKGGYVVKFEAGSTIPVSKALQTQQTQDVVNALMPLASAGVGYDPVKLGDALIKSLDKDPGEFHIDKSPDQGVEQARQDMQINLASMEDQEITKGGNIPPLGTPYASAAHTMIHIAFLKSPQGRALPMDKYSLLVKHIMGEITMQESRGSGGVASLMGQGQPPALDTNSVSGGSPPQTPVPPPSQNGQQSSPFNMAARINSPAMIQGGESTPAATQRGSVMSRVFSLFKGGK